MVSGEPAPVITILRHQITWEVLKRATVDLVAFRHEMGEAAYNEQTRSFQDFFCDYINTGSQCRTKGCNVSPMGGTKAGGKSFKVRWALPGMGKSGGLRLAVVAYCDAKRVKIAAAWMRRDDPADDEFADAVEGA